MFVIFQPNFKQFWTFLHFSMWSRIMYSHTWLLITHFKKVLFRGGGVHPPSGILGFYLCWWIGFKKYICFALEVFRNCLGKGNKLCCFYSLNFLELVCFRRIMIEYIIPENITKENPWKFVETEGLVQLLGLVIIKIITFSWS